MAKKAAKEAKGNWLVRMRCTVEKELYLENCTEQQARDDPWEYTLDERELNQDDTEFISLEATE
jgi:hypothetical protein